MTRYIVTYSVPIEVVVDLSDKSVEKVVIDTDGLSVALEVWTHPEDTLVTHQITDPAKVEAVTNVSDGLERSGEWPTWDWGW